MNRFLGWALERAQEKTTWLGVTLLLSAAGMTVSPELEKALMEIGLAAAGLGLVVLKEHAKGKGAKK